MTMFPYPALVPSTDLVAQDQARHGRQGVACPRRKYRAEMAEPDASRTLDLLAALSHQTNFPLGCYCEDEFH